MHPGTTPVVRLEGPLALGHGSTLLSRLADPAGEGPPDARLPLLSSTRTGAVPKPGRSRAATFGRLFEGTEVACAGQTGLIGTGHRGRSDNPYRLARPLKPVSFWQSRHTDKSCASQLFDITLMPICCVLRTFPVLYTTVDNYVDSFGTDCYP